MAGFDLNSYVDVQTRITRFWADHPDGAIRTMLASNPDDFKTCRYRADVYVNRDNPHPDATGYAFEIAGSGMANKTSHEENCETSAIGRALANLGYATSQKDRPSRQEMGKVERGTEAPKQPRNATKPANATPDTPPANLDQVKVMKALHAEATKHGIDHSDLHNLIVAKGFDSMSKAPVDALIELGKAVKHEPEKLKAWLAKQQELMPSPEDVPNPDRFTS